LNASGPLPPVDHSDPVTGGLPEVTAIHPRRRRPKAPRPVRMARLPPADARGTRWSRPRCPADWFRCRGGVRPRLEGAW